MLISFNFKNGLPACMSSKLDIFLLFDLSLSVGPIYFVEETSKLQFPLKTIQKKYYVCINLIKMYLDLGTIVLIF
jgi:hypothetical protein